MKSTIYILILILFLGAKSKYVSRIELENQQLRNQLSKCDYAYKTNNKTLDSILEENRKWNNHAVRMQYIVGVKNPDTVFTWKEKIIHPINLKRTLKFKN